MKPQDILQTLIEDAGDGCFMLIRKRGDNIVPEVGLLYDNEEKWKWIEFTFTYEKKDKDIGEVLLEEKTSTTRVKREDILWVKPVDWMEMSYVESKYYDTQWKELESALKRLGKGHKVKAKKRGGFLRWIKIKLLQILVLTILAIALLIWATSEK